MKQTEHDLKPHQYRKKVNLNVRIRHLFQLFITDQTEVFFHVIATNLHACRFRGFENESITQNNFGNKVDNKYSVMMMNFRIITQPSSVFRL